MNTTVSELQKRKPNRFGTSTLRDLRQIERQMIKVVEMHDVGLGFFEHFRKRGCDVCVDEPTIRRLACVVDQEDRNSRIEKIRRLTNTVIGSESIMLPRKHCNWGVELFVIMQCEGLSVKLRSSIKQRWIAMIHH